MAAGYDQSLAIGDVYAEALLMAANEQGETDEVAAQFADLIAYMDRDPDFAAFLTVVTVDDDARRTTLEVLFRTRLNDLLLNALQVLNDRGRTDILRGMYERFRLRLEEQRNQIEVDVRTAVPLSEDIRENLRQGLSARLGKDVILVPRVDETLIGGIVVQIGDRRLDGSLSQHLRKMRRQFMDRASTEVFGGRQYVET